MIAKDPPQTVLITANSTGLYPASATDLPKVQPSRVPVTLFAISVAVIITNLFAPQTLVGLMASSFGLTTALSGFVAMVSLLGYSAGLFFIVPLADLVENRRLVLLMLGTASLCAVGVIIAPNIATLFSLLFVLGAACSAIQVLIPSAAAMAAPEKRGQVLGDIMSGLMVGILLSRPIASLLASRWGWQGFYVASAVAIAVLCLTLAYRLPVRRPAATTSYWGLIASLWKLFSGEPVLRKRSITAAIVMAAFNIFWTSVVFVLGAAPFHLGQKGAAIFALVGAGGAFFTPMVGRWSDKGWGERVTSIAHVVLIAGFAVAALGGIALSLPSYILLACLGLSAVALDVGVLGDQTVGRYQINLLRPEARGRINAIFVGIFFIGGAVGSAAAGFLWSVGGWAAICMGGALSGLLAIVVHRTIPSRG